jgi:hypothetical protein
MDQEIMQSNYFKYTGVTTVINFHMLLKKYLLREGLVTHGLSYATGPQWMNAIKTRQIDAADTHCSGVLQVSLMWCVAHMHAVFKCTCSISYIQQQE